MSRTRFAELLPEHLNDPDRFAQIAERHRRALSWEPQAYIPLGIIVNDPAHLTGISYDRWLEPEPFFEAQAKALRDTLLVGSDCLPALGMNHLGDVLIPTMFGARLFVPEEMGESAQDTGATPWPVLGRIGEVDELRMPEMSDGLMPRFAEIARLWRAWAPEWIRIVTPFPLGPFSLAMELRGSDLLVDLFDDPERCHRLLKICAEAQIRTERHLQGILGSPGDPPLSNFGVRTLGRRIGDDSIITLSPGYIRQFAVPHLEMIARELGAATIHFCTLVDHRADQVFEPLADSPLISTASSQFAFQYYESHLSSLRGRLSIESLYGTAREYLAEQWGSFRGWAEEFVPRFKNESGLVLYVFDVTSVDEGRELWSIWQDAHKR
jgi:hypothetical protein